MIRYSFLIFAILLQASCASFTGDDVFPDDDYDSFPVRHDRIRRFVRVMSRKPHPGSLPETGIGFSGHFVNLLKGGTVGLEFQIPHVDRFGKRFHHWKGIVDSIGYGKKGDEEEDKIDGGEKRVDVEEKRINEDENKVDVEEKTFDGENKVDAEMKRKDFEMLEREDYGNLINPRVRRRPEH